MRKQQKIIELRTAANIKVAEIQSKIAFARSEAAGERARLMWERASELDGLEAGSTERFDVLAKYRAKLSGVNEKMEVKVAQLKYEIQQAKAECERQCAAAEDDPETETEEDNDNDVTVKGFQPQQDTVYCDGSEHTARIVARRLINKMPHIPRGGYIFVHIISNDDGEYFLNISAMGENQDDYVSTIFSKGDGKKEEAIFVESAREMFKADEDEASTKAAEPLSRALDAVFGGNPVEQVDNLISDTVKDRKEGKNE